MIFNHWYNLWTIRNTGVLTYYIHRINRSRLFTPSTPSLSKSLKGFGMLVDQRLSPALGSRDTKVLGTSDRGSVWSFVVLHRILDTVLFTFLTFTLWNNSLLPLTTPNSVPPYKGRFVHWRPKDPWLCFLVSDFTDQTKRFRNKTEE